MGLRPARPVDHADRAGPRATRIARDAARTARGVRHDPRPEPAPDGGGDRRSEEHTSELQSLMRISCAVFCLKTQNTIQPYNITTFSYAHAHLTIATVPSRRNKHA